MNTRWLVAVWLVNGVGATLYAYDTFARYPDHSGLALARWVLFYVATIVYPAWWTWLQFRRTHRPVPADGGLDRGLLWAPLVVGATSLLSGLGLLRAVIR